MFGLGLLRRLPWNVFLALIDSGSEVNAMHPAVRKTDVGTQKIDGSALETFGMVIAGFRSSTSWK